MDVQVLCETAVDQLQRNMPESVTDNDSMSALPSLLANADNFVNGSEDL